MVNEIKVPYAGEIYHIHVSKDDKEIALATFSGLFFGKFEIGPQGRPYQVWETNKVYFRDKLISKIIPLRPKFYLVAEYSKPGYHLVDRSSEELDPGRIEDRRAEHNSGCTDLVLVPMYDPKWFPYAISRNKFKIDLIDLDEKRVYTICAESSTAALTPKMVVESTRQKDGHSIEIYFTCQVADRRAVKCMQIEPKIVKKM